MNNFLETNHQPNVDNKNELFQAFKRVYDIINENSGKINTMFDIISVDENPANKCPLKNSDSGFIKVVQYKDTCYLYVKVSNGWKKILLT
jgi:hypothetical protein